MAQCTRSTSPWHLVSFLRVVLSLASNPITRAFFRRRWGLVFEIQISLATEERRCKMKQQQQLRIRLERKMMCVWVCVWEVGGERQAATNRWEAWRRGCGSWGRGEVMACATLMRASPVLQLKLISWNRCFNCLGLTPSQIFSHKFWHTGNRFCQEKSRWSVNLLQSDWLRLRIKACDSMLLRGQTLSNYTNFG